MQTIRTLAKGQVVIPAAVREHFGVKAGSLWELKIEGDHLEMRPLPKDPIASFCGSLAAQPGLADALIEEHRQEAVRNGQS